MTNGVLRFVYYSESPDAIGKLESKRDNIWSLKYPDTYPQGCLINSNANTLVSYLNNISRLGENTIRQLRRRPPERHSLQKGYHGPQNPQTFNNRYGFCYFYYDNGREDNLKFKRPLLSADAKVAKISSATGWRWQGSNYHSGIDIVVKDSSNTIGKPVLACGAGLVTLVRKNRPGAGNYIVIYHGYMKVQEKYGGKRFHVRSRYLHLQGFQQQVRVGRWVQAGDQIGTAGKTGTKAAHLHFDLDAAGSVWEGMGGRDSPEPRGQGRRTERPMRGCTHNKKIAHDKDGRRLHLSANDCMINPYLCKSSALKK